jgi:hypothetical protein
MDEEIAPGGREVRDPPWDPWRPEDIARLLSGVSALPLLGPGAVGWLRWALLRVHPGHAWIGAL